MSNTFLIKNTEFSKDNALIIAEIGTSHNGNINKAKELIHAAYESGAVAIKTQIVYADEILHPNTGIVNLPTGKIPLYNHFKSLEKNIDFFLEIAEYTKKHRLLFSASPFGLKSAKILNELNPDFFKIASPELNHFALLENIANYQKPIIISSGVSLLKDIEKAIMYLQNNSYKQENNIALLHCVTSYPAPETDYNLSILNNLSGIFGLPVGISDHSLSEYLVPMLSLAHGGCIIEKHFCLSKKDGGIDDRVALTPEQFTKMTSTLKSIYFKSYDFIIDAIINLGYSKKTISDIEGNGIKRLSPSEEANYTRTNRSLHYIQDLKKGHKINLNDISILRTEKKLSVGEAPDMLDLFINSILQTNVSAGDGAILTDIICRNK